MSYECEKFEEIESPINCENPTLKQILEELNRLKLENEFLKADRKEMLREILKLRNDVDALHNKPNENNEDIGILNEYVEEYLCGCESEEELKTYEDALNNMSVKK